MLKIHFLGAAGTVTGSCYLVESDNSKFLVDCGMFQGLDVEDRNYLPFEFDPEKIDFVLLTHAHMDHSGLLPKLVAQGFRGKIYCTPYTAKIVTPLLLDAAKIQEINESRQYKSRRNVANSLGVKSAALYHTEDALATIDQLDTKNFDEEFSIFDMSFSFEVVGHILGAASIMAKVGDKIICFSGDIGRRFHPFLQEFNQGKKLSADYVIMEALYGGVVHEDREKMEAELIKEINHTLERDGNVIIPAFSVQRTQELLNMFKNAYQDNLISGKPDIFLDSPLATKVTNIYSHSIFKEGRKGSSLFDFDKVRYVNNSKKVLRSKTKSIVIAGSGMCEGGRILGHLIKNLPNSKNSIFIVGFQAEGTLGRELTDGAKVVTINGKKVPVRARIHNFYGFSAHADHEDLTTWLNRFDPKKLKTTFLVHAESERAQKFKEIEAKKNFYIPQWKEIYDLT